MQLTRQQHQHLWRLSRDYLARKDLHAVISDSLKSVGPELTAQQIARLYRDRRCPYLQNQLQAAVHTHGLADMEVQ